MQLFVLTSSIEPRSTSSNVQERPVTVEDLVREWRRSFAVEENRPHDNNEESEQFDINDRRHVKHPTTNWDTLFHVLKGNVGAGVLSLPDAFKNAGWLVGTLGTSFISLICIHCMHILVKSSHVVAENHKRINLTYGDVGELAFKSGPESLRKYSSLCRNIINFFICVSQLGICCVYFVFISENIKQLIEEYLPPLDIHLYMLFLLLPLLLLNCVRDLKKLAPCSMVANMFMLAGLIIILSYEIQGPIDISKRKMFSSWSQLPLFFGTTVYTFEGIALVLPLEAEMEHPRAFIGCMGVLNIGMITATCMYILIGFFGYVKYGDTTAGSVTLNLPPNILAQSVKLMVAISVFFAYALQFYVPIVTLWTPIKKHIKNKKKQVFYELVFRMVLVIFTFTLAEAIPKLGLFISLVGSVGASFLSLILPPLIECITCWGVEGAFGNFKWRLWKNIFIFLFGLLGFSTGTYASINAIVDSFKKDAVVNVVAQF